MKFLLKICVILLGLSLSLNAVAQSKDYDVFAPISKYLVKGNADALSAWFDDSLEVAILSRGTNASKAQARQIIKAFFDAHTPQTFSITHTTGRSNMKYAVGQLNAGGETFNVTIFVSCNDGTYLIQQIKIERL